MLEKIKKLATEGLTIPMIADRLEISYSSAYQNCQKANLKMIDGRSKQRSDRVSVLDPYKDFLIEQYMNGQSIQSIYDEYLQDICDSHVTLFLQLKKWKVKTRHKNGKSELSKPKLSKSMLYDLYWKQKKSLAQIQREFPSLYRTPTMVSYDMQKHDIPRRSYIHAGRNLWDNNEEYRNTIIEQNRKLSTDRFRNAPSGLEILCMEALNSYNIDFIHQFQIPDSSLKHNYDFHIVNTHILIEMDGDYWHATVEAKQRDAIFDHVARKHGYEVIRILESETKKDNQWITKILQTMNYSE